MSVLHELYRYNFLVFIPPAPEVGVRCGKKIQLSLTHLVLRSAACVHFPSAQAGCEKVNVQFGDDEKASLTSGFTEVVSELPYLSPLNHLVSKTC
jgi:hypothetical protein